MEDPIVTDIYYEIYDTSVIKLHLTIPSTNGNSYSKLFLSCGQNTTTLPYCCQVNVLVFWAEDRKIMYWLARKFVVSSCGI